MANSGRTKREKRFQGLRALALVALFCTVVLAVVIFVESAMPGAESAKQSTGLSESIKQLVDVKDNAEAVELQRIAVQLDDKMYFIGDTVKLQIEKYPEEAALPKLNYRTDHDGIISVDEAGTVTFLAYGQVNLTVVAEENADLECEIQVVCRGLNPAAVTEIAGLSQTVFQAGEVTPFTLFTENGDIVSPEACDPHFADESLGQIKADAFCGMRAGVTVLSFSYEGRELGSFEVTVTEREGFVAPTRFIYEAEREITLNEFLSTDDLLTGVEPSAAWNYNDCIYKIVKTSRSRVLTLVNRQGEEGVRANRTGTVTLELTSRYNPECTARILITVVEPVPTVLSILGRDRVVLDESYRFRAFGTSNYVDNVTWSVVSGKAKVEEGGIVTPQRLGKLVLRATSTADPSVYTDYEVRVSLFSNFQLFVRKIIGHFGLFVVLGFGLASTFFLLLKPRWLSLPLSVVSGVASAMFSEFLQTPLVTTGRYATWTDVAIDSVGAAVGIAVATLVLFAYILIRRRTADWGEVKAAFSPLTFRTAFRFKRNQALPWQDEPQRTTVDAQQMEEAAASDTTDPDRK